MLAAYLTLLYYTCETHLLFISHLSSTREAHQSHHNGLGARCASGLIRLSFMAKYIASSTCMLTAISFLSSIYTLSAIAVSRLRAIPWFLIPAQ